MFGTQLCRAFCRAGRRIFIFLSHQDIFHFIQFVFATIRGISDFSPIDRTFTTANIFTNSRHFTKYCPDNKKSGQSRTIRKTFINKVVRLLHAADCLHFCRLINVIKLYIFNSANNFLSGVRNYLGKIMFWNYIKTWEEHLCN